MNPEINAKRSSNTDADWTVPPLELIVSLFVFLILAGVVVFCWIVVPLLDAPIIERENKLFAEPVVELCTQPTHQITKTVPSGRAIEWLNANPTYKLITAYTEFNKTIMICEKSDQGK